MARLMGTDGFARPRRDSGFTLLEILVALGVLAVATWILIALFTSSLSYAQTSRFNKLAAGVAEEQLHRIVATPAAFEWPKLTDMKAGQPVKLALRDDKKQALPGPYKAEAPALKDLTASKDAGLREGHFYSSMEWQPYAVLPKDANAPYVEVSVVVRWSHAREHQKTALTAIVPKAKVEGVS